MQNNRWNHVYTGTVYTGEKTSSSDIASGVMIGSNGSIYASSHIYTGVAKTGGGDGKSGLFLGANGNIGMTSELNPTIYFYRSNSITSTAYIQNTGPNALTTNSWILPDTPNSYNLGSSSFAWGHLYMENHLWVGKIRSADDTNTGTIVAPTGNIYFRSATDPGIYFYRNNSGSVSGYLVCTIDGLKIANSFIPNAANERDLGSADLVWRNLYATTATFTNRPKVNGVEVALTSDTTYLKDFSTTGSGNAVTYIERSEDGLTLTATKGNTFVDIASNQTITGAKTFTSNVSVPSISANQTGDIGSIGSRFNVLYAQGGSFSGSITTGSRDNYLDGLSGCIITNTGAIFLSGNNTTLYFQPNNITNPNTYITCTSANNFAISGNWLPASNNERTLGTPTNRWLNVYAGNISTGTRTGASSTDNGIVLTSNGFLYSSNSIYSGIAKTGGSDGKTGLFLGANGNIGMTSDTTPGIYFYRTNSTSTTASILNIDTKKLQFEAHIYPSVSNTYDIGSASIYWRNMYVNNINTKVSIFAGFNIYTGGKTGVVDGLPGVGINNAGQIYCTGYTDTSGTTYYPRLVFYNSSDTSKSTTIEGRSAGNIGTSANFYPLAHKSYDLGTTNTIWRYIYCSTMFLGDKRITTDTNTGLMFSSGGTAYASYAFYSGVGKYAASDGITGTVLHGNGNIYLTSDTNPAIYFYRTNVTVNTAYLQNTADSILTTNSSIHPLSSNKYNLGSSSLCWNNIYTNSLHYSTLVNSSDIRLKNIQSQFTTPILSKIDDLSLFYFTRKEENPDKVYLGISAQEIKQLIPEVVTEDEQGYLGVDYANLATVIAIQSAKELKAKIRLLEDEILELKAQGKAS